MRRILVVQADLASCRELENILQAKQNQWDMCFVAGAMAAKDQLDRESWDIVISDLLSESDRFLLADVRSYFPDIIRFGLVRQSRPSPSQVSVVHQYLVRPFAVNELEVAVERSCMLRDLVHSELMIRTVGELGTLPSAPSVYMKLVRTLNEPNPSIDEISRVVESDVGISAKVLQIVNSAIFRTRQEIATVKLATSFLGLNFIKNLVLSTEILCAFENIQGLPGFSIEELQAHSLFTARIAGSLYLQNDTRDAAIIASLLHDVGKLILAWKMPERFARVLGAVQEQGRPFFQIEQELYGITHAEIGGYLLGLWGLPIPVTEAIAFHHTPGRVPHYHFDCVGAVYVANLLAHELDGSLKEGHQLWDTELLKSLDLAHKLPIWGVMAQEISLSQDRSQPLRW